MYCPMRNGSGDKPLTKYFLHACDAFVTMSDAVMNDLRKFEKTKPAKRVIHPLYDNFGEMVIPDGSQEILERKEKTSDRRR